MSVELCRRGLSSTRCAVFARCLARARAECCGIICQQAPSSLLSAQAILWPTARESMQRLERAVPELSLGGVHDVAINVLLHVCQPLADCTICARVGGWVYNPQAVNHVVGRNRSVDRHSHAQRACAAVAHTREGRVIEPAIARHPVNVTVSPVCPCPKSS
jgi:hypothetical protein